MKWMAHPFALSWSLHARLSIRQRVHKTEALTGGPWTAKTQKQWQLKLLGSLRRRQAMRAPPGTTTDHRCCQRLPVGQEKCQNDKWSTGGKHHCRLGLHTPPTVKPRCESQKHLQSPPDLALGLSHVTGQPLGSLGPCVGPV
jgi:hypothetical protein